MLRRASAAFIGLLTVMLTASVLVRAHEGHDHKIMGTITMAAADHVTLKDTDGKDVTITITKDTKVRSRPAMKVDEIKPGTRVVVTATQQKDKTFTAKIIEVGAAPAATK